MSESDFEIANSVMTLLKDLDRDRQGRILRWVSESLGITPSESLHRQRNDQPAPGFPGGLPIGSGTDIKSFVGSKNPKSDNQFAATVAYYYRFEAPPDQRAETITADTLQEATRLSGRTRLGDPGKTLRNAKDQGYLDAAERGAYKINSVGENLVAITLSNEGQIEPARQGRKRGKMKKGKRS